MQFEQRVGGPQRLSAYDLGMTKHAEALRGKAGVLERVEDVGPNLAQYADLTRRAYSGPTETVRPRQSVTQATARARATNPFMRSLV
jgi:hypothetical protein